MHCSNCCFGVENWRSLRCTLHRVIPGTYKGARQGIRTTVFGEIRERSYQDILVSDSASYADLIRKPILIPLVRAVQSGDYARKVRMMRVFSWFERRVNNILFTEYRLFIDSWYIFVQKARGLLCRRQPPVVNRLGTFCKRTIHQLLAYFEATASATTKVSLSERLALFCSSSWAWGNSAVSLECSMGTWTLITSQVGHTARTGNES